MSNSNSLHQNMEDSKYYSMESERNVEFDDDDGDDDDDHDAFFEDLYEQYENSIKAERSNKEKLSRQLKGCRDEQHQIFLNNRNTYREDLEKEIVNITLKDACDVENKMPTGNHLNVKPTKKPWHVSNYW